VSDINEISAALAKAQGEFPAIRKNKTVTKKGVSKASGREFEYKYTYADLTEIIDSVRPALAANGLSFTQSIEMVSNMSLCVTRLLHSSGQHLTSSFPIIMDAKDMQSLAAITSYAKRYSLSMLLGISPDDDPDANDYEDARIETKPARQATKQTQAGDSSSQPQSDAKPVKTREIKNVVTGESRSVSNVGSYHVKFGKKYYGKTLEQMGYEEVKSYLAWIKKETEGSGKPMSPEGVDFVEHAEAFLKTYEPKEDLQIPF